jgi:hypothetical protein
VESAASRLTELLAGDPVKAIPAGLEQHALKPDACGLLRLGALGDQGSSIAQVLGEAIADEFELAQVQ